MKNLSRSLKRLFSVCLLFLFVSTYCLPSLYSEGTQLTQQQVLLLSSLKGKLAQSLTQLELQEKTIQQLRADLKSSEKLTAELEQQNQESKKQVESLKSQIASLEKQSDGWENQYKEAQKALTNANNTISQLKAQLETLLKTSTQSLEEQIKDLNNELKKQKIEKWCVIGGSVIVDGILIWCAKDVIVAGLKSIGN